MWKPAIENMCMKLNASLNENYGAPLAYVNCKLDEKKHVRLIRLNKIFKSAILHQSLQKKFDPNIACLCPVVVLHSMLHKSSGFLLGERRTKAYTKRLSSKVNFLCSTFCVQIIFMRIYRIVCTFNAVLPIHIQI